MEMFSEIWRKISRDITLPTIVQIVKTMVFPVVMYECESWTIKKAEHWRTDAFQTVVLEETLESPLDSKEIKESILKEINPEYSLEGLMLISPLAIWCEKLTHWKKILMLGKTGTEEEGAVEDEIRDRCW